MNDMKDVRETHGMSKDPGSVIVSERDECIALTSNDTYAGRTCFITPNEARHLASKLYRLAKRVESRL